MKINCPHCNKDFEARSAIIRPAKDRYKWYEFTSSHTFCPICKKRYQQDISIKSAIFFVLLIVAAFIVGALGYRLVALPAVLLVIYFFIKHLNRLVKIVAK